MRIDERERVEKIREKLDELGNEIRGQHVTPRTQRWYENLLQHTLEQIYPERLGQCTVTSQFDKGIFTVNLPPWFVLLHRQYTEFYANLKELS